MTIEDLLEGNSITKNREGYTATRSFQVTDLDPNTDAGARMALALTADKIPQPGDKFPAVEGLFVSDIDCEFQGPTMARVTVRYAMEKPRDKQPNNDPAQVSVGATLQTVTTTNDFEGKPIVVKWVQPASDAAVTAAIQAGTPIPPDADVAFQTGEVQVQIPQVVLRYTRRETSNPQAKALQYVGKINDGQFQGHPEHTWLCSRIEGTSNDNGRTFVVDYEFQFKENTWTAEVVYIDRGTNYPPDFPSRLSNRTLSIEGPYFGLTRAQVYKVENFNALGLDGSGNSRGGPEGITGL